jgi:hypothetical protein
MHTARTRIRAHHDGSQHSTCRFVYAASISTDILSTLYCFNVFLNTIDGIPCTRYRPQYVDTRVDESLHIYHLQNLFYTRPQGSHHIFLLAVAIPCHTTIYSRVRPGLTTLASETHSMRIRARRTLAVGASFAGNMGSPSCTTHTNAYAYTYTYTHTHTRFSGRAPPLLYPITSLLASHVPDGYPAHGNLTW